MSVSSHLGIILLIIVGVVTIFGVVVIAAIETRRKERGQPSILSGLSKKGNGKTGKES
jgi:hypothetical protein